MRLIIAERKYLPIYGGVYLVVQGDRVVYIGLASNLHYRWRHHELVPRLGPNDWLCWCRIDDPAIRIEVERCLIKQLAPSLNRTFSPANRYTIRTRKLPGSYSDDEIAQVEADAQAMGLSPAVYVRGILGLPQVEIGRPRLKLTA